MQNKKVEEVPRNLIEDMQTFLKFYEYGYHMLDSLVKRHLEGTDIIPQVTALGSNSWARGIFYFITTSDENAEAILRSDLIDKDSHQKLLDIRLKYRPVLNDILSLGGAVNRGEINPISSVRFSSKYERDDEISYLEITAYSGQREIFRIMQDASELLTCAESIVKTCSDSFEWCQRQGLPLRKLSIKRLDELQKELQNSSAQLSNIVQKYLTTRKQSEATTD
ncbi:unnamed protein product [marine sediment metagenome]|uniref:Uncharacterized protein n=1 Tax=marine sediment metagenome TaxID=412755 RepID=X1KTZ9_9ZZZZ